MRNVENCNIEIGLSVTKVLLTAFHVVNDILQIFRFTIRSCGQRGNLIKS